MNKLLMHACCGPCASNNEAFTGHDVTLFFNGDNFDTAEEYARRLEALKKVDKEVYGNSELIVDKYNPKVFDTCEDCIRYRLERAAKAAADSGCNLFTTTLTVSPHKNTDTVNRIGREISKAFLELNLKKNNGFGKTVQKSKELGLYRQTYCGCAKLKSSE